MFQELSVNWHNDPTAAQQLLFGWLEVIGVECSSHKDLHSTLTGKVVIIPYESWIYQGFSGCSVPPSVALDYHNVTAAVVPENDVQGFLENQYTLFNVKLVEGIKTHYYANDGDALCGSDSANKVVTKSMAEVTCPHCSKEMMLRLAPASETPS